MILYEDMDNVTCSDKRFDDVEKFKRFCKKYIGKWRTFKNIREAKIWDTEENEKEAGERR